MMHAVKQPAARLAFFLGASFVSCGIALDAWHAHGLADGLSAADDLAVGRAIFQQELAGLALVALGLLDRRGWATWLCLLAFLAGPLLFSLSIYLEKVGGVEGTTVVAPFGGSSQILGWLLLGFLGLRSAGREP